MNEDGGLMKELEITREIARLLAEKQMSATEAKIVLDIAGRIDEAQANGQHDHVWIPNIGWVLITSSEKRSTKSVSANVRSERKS